MPANLFARLVSLMRLPVTRLLPQLLLCVGLAACTRPDGAQGTLPGSELFAGCSPCHGAAGEGNPALGAPNIAALPAWYVEASLVKYRTGLRGYHPDDYEGLRMRPMSRQLMNEEEVKAVAAFISTLKHTKPATTLTGGDATAGAAAFAVCSACHGPDGKGMEALKAPPLAGQSDWYMLSQLKKFKGGLRGANPADTSGGTMRPMSLTLADEQAMKNVLAHVATLNR
jgi:cytochrome c553